MADRPTAPNAGGTDRPPIPSSAPSSATITTGAPAQQSSISGVALALTLVGTASSYLWGARLASGGTGGSWVTTGFSSSTSATPTYTRPTDDDYEVRCVVTMTDGSTPEARSTVASLNSVGGGPTWTVVQITDWTSCTTTSRSSAGTLNVYEQDGTTLKSAVTVGITSSPIGSIACTNGVGLTSTFTSGSGAFFAHAPIGTPSSATKKIAVQSIALVSSLTTDDRACGAANGTNPASGTQNFCVFDTSGANNQITVVNRVGGTPTTALALSTASSLGTYVCVTVINDMKQQTIYVNTASSASDYTDMTALTGGTNLVPRYDASSAGTTPAIYARTYSSVYQFLYAGSGGTATCAGTRLLEAPAES